MPIDVHAHYVPIKVLDVLQREGARYGVNVVEHEPTCQKCLRFEYGLQIRPFFPKLVEPVESRIDSMQRAGIDRQVLSVWTDIFGYALPAPKGEAWHRLLTSAMRLPHASSSIRVSKRNDDDRGNQLSRTRPLTAR